MRLFVIVALLLAGCVSSTTRVDSVRLKRLSLAERFELHAFYDDDQFGGAEHSLYRWLRPPPGFQVAGPDMEEPLRPFTPDVEETLATIAEASGMEVDTRDPNAVVLVYGDQRTISALIPTASADEVFEPEACASTWVFEGQVIVGAIIYIVDRLPPDEIRSCLAQELVQSMGLSADLDGAGDTVLDSYSTLIRPSPIDQRLLSILYDPRLRPGMSRQEAMPIVRTIIAERGW